MSSLFSTAVTTALSLSISFGAIALGIGINALQKRNDDVDFVKEHVPTGITVEIEDHDAFRSGVNVTVISGVLALTSILTLLYLAFRPLPNTPACSPSSKPHSRIVLLTSAFLHTLFTLWILASLIAYTAIVRTRSASVSAFLPNGQSLPQGFVEQQERALGVSAVYWDKRYLRLLAILPWFTFLFGLIASVVLFRAASKARGFTTGAGAATGSDAAITAGEPRGSVGKEEREKEEVV